MAEEQIEITQKTTSVDYVTRMIEEIHGDLGVEMFDKLLDELKKDNPDLSLEDAIRKFEQEPTHGQTEWFRVYNLKVVAEQLVPRVERQDGEPVKIGVIGCSTGQEAWSLAIHLENAGHDDVAVYATDSSPDRVTTAQEGKYKVWTTPDKFAQGILPYSGTDDEKGQAVHDRKLIDSGERWLHKSLKHGYLPDNYPDGNVPDYAYNKEEFVIMEPSQSLREKVNFGVHNIIDGPLTEKQDVIVINNVLLHFPNKTRDNMLRNIIDSLNTGGFIVMEKPQSPRRNEEVAWLSSYADWREAITQNFPLQRTSINVWYSDEPKEVEGYYQLK